MMTRLDFTNAAELIFAAHGKKLPSTEILDAIYRRISELPPDFLTFAVRHLEDAVDLPKNLGRYLLRELWPEYLEKHPEQRAMQERQCCPLCAPELPGWRKIWGPAPDYQCRIVRCTCGNARALLDEPVLSDAEWQARGYFTEMPFHYTPDNLPQVLQRVLGKNEPPRPEHVREIEIMNW